MLRFLRLAEVMERTGYSRPTIYRKMRNAEFPQAYSLGGGESGRREAWPEQSLLAKRVWIHAKPVPKTPARCTPQVIGHTQLPILAAT